MTSPRYVCLHCNTPVPPGVCTCDRCLKAGHITLKGGGCPVCDKKEKKEARNLQDSVRAVLQDMLFLSVLVLLVPLSCLVCAPAPRAKTQPAFSPVGEWRLTWVGSSGPAVFRRDGSMSYFWGPEPSQYRWDGQWELRGKTLHTWSWCESNAPPEPDSRRSEAYHWPLDVEKFSPKTAEGPTRSGRWKLEK